MQIWSAMDNPHLKYKLRIFAHSGVDNDANEEEDAFVLGWDVNPTQLRWGEWYDTIEEEYALSHLAKT